MDRLYPSTYFLTPLPPPHTDTHSDPTVSVAQRLGVPFRVDHLRATPTPTSIPDKMAAIVDSPINLEAGRQPKSPKTKPAAMVGGRRRPQGKPQKTKAEGDDDRAPPVIESIIVPVEVPEGDELVSPSATVI